MVVLNQPETVNYWQAFCLHVHLIYQLEEDVLSTYKMPTCQQLVENSPVQGECGLRLPPSSWWSRTGRIWVPKSQGLIRLHKGMSYYWNIEYSIWSDNHRPDCGPLRRIWNESIVLFSTSRWPCCYVHGSPVVYSQHYRPVEFDFFLNFQKIQAVLCDFQIDLTCTGLPWCMGNIIVDVGTLL